MHELLEIQYLTNASERKTVKTKIFNKKVEEIEYTFTQFENSYLLSEKANETETKLYKNLQDTQLQQERQEELESLNQLKQSFLVYKNNTYKLL